MTGVHWLQWLSVSTNICSLAIKVSFVINKAKLKIQGMIYQYLLVLSAEHTFLTYQQLQHWRWRQGLAHHWKCKSGFGTNAKLTDPWLWHFKNSLHSFIFTTKSLFKEQLQHVLINRACNPASEHYSASRQLKKKLLVVLIQNRRSTRDLSAWQKCYFPLYRGAVHIQW